MSYVRFANTSSSSSDTNKNNNKLDDYEWLVTSTVATALERGLDKDLHAELVQEAKDSAGRIGQVCHDHPNAFLEPVASAVALGIPSNELESELKEQNDEIGGGKKEDAAAAEDGANETRSSLSSLTGDDVSVGTDRVFFAKSLSHLCASVVGFSAVEAALELGNFADEEEEAREAAAGGATETSSSTTRFRSSSARYERTLVAELGALLRKRAIGATLVELARGSCLMAALRSASRLFIPVLRPVAVTRNFWPWMSISS